MSLANLEYENFVAIHNLIQEVMSNHNNEWNTIDLDKDEHGNDLFPSSDASINFLLESVTELSEAFDNDDLRNKVLNHSECTNRLSKLLEKVETIINQTNCELSFEKLEVIWWDFAMLVNTAKSIHIEEFTERFNRSDLCTDSIKTINNLLYQSVEMMKLSAFSKELEQKHTGTIH